MRSALRPPITVAATILLWAFTTVVVIVATEAQQPAPRPVEQGEPPSANPAQKPATEKAAPPKAAPANRFSSLDDEEEEQAAPPKGAAPQKPSSDKAAPSNRFSLIDDEEEQESSCTADAKPPFCGQAGCIKCHAKQAKVYNEGPHARGWNERTPSADIGCERCHGPGKAHDGAPAAKGLIRNFVSMSAREANETCLSCHNRQTHASWQGGMHDARNVSCVSCHSVHRPKSERSHLKSASVTETCAQCHREKAAKMQRASHMPVREGKLECSTCHDPHGSSNVRMLRAGNTVNESCLSCHNEKRGPFLWEHAPVAENCTTCHDPHGSSNDRMLTARAPMLCQRCHIATRHPASPYDGATLAFSNNRMLNRGCVNCHSMIHGSNHAAGVFFMR